MCRLQTEQTPSSRDSSCTLIYLIQLQQLPTQLNLVCLLMQDSLLIDMSSEKRASSFGSGQIVKRQKSDTSLAVTNLSQNGALIQGVSRPDIAT